MRMSACLDGGAAAAAWWWPRHELWMSFPVRDYLRRRTHQQGHSLLLAGWLRLHVSTRVAETLDYAVAE